MVKLTKADIKTTEVLGWKGFHVFHYEMSSCSQKLRIFLNLKKIDWQSHPVDLLNNQNVSEWYLGINPRGLVPVLVHDGDVHIESNDILLYLEKLFPTPALIPAGATAEIEKMLEQENDLHLDFRALSFRFMFNPPETPKTPDVIEIYTKAGTGTVEGVDDVGKARELEFWRRYAKEGVTDDTARTAAQKFKKAFDELDVRLASQPNLLGKDVSLLDIAWFIYVNRLQTAGYPLARLHPHLSAWFDRLGQQPAFAKEIQLPPPLRNAIDETHRRQRADHTTLLDVAGF
jgi:glutathione S-transferase